QNLRDQIIPVEAMQIHEQKGKIAGDIGAAQIGIELDAIKDLQRVVVIEANVISAEVAVPIARESIDYAFVEERVVALKKRLDRLTDQRALNGTQCFAGNLLDLVEVVRDDRHLHERIVRIGRANGDVVMKPAQPLADSQTRPARYCAFRDQPVEHRLS